MLQAEIFAILKAIEAIAGGPTSDSESYNIFVNNHAALRATALVCSCSFVKSLRTFGPDRIRLCWVPGHSGMPGNEMTNALTRLGKLSECDLVVHPDPQSASSMDGSEAKSRGVGGTDQIVVFLYVCGLLLTIREQIGYWPWIWPV